MTLRILILNWRCPRNPRAGGAETFTFEIARRWVQQGDAVEWFASSFPGAPAEEFLDGVRIVRSGRQWTVHWLAFRHYHGKVSQRFDVVVDQVNTIPFLTPLWATVPAVMLIHQLAREVWWYETKFPLSAIGFMAEPLYLRLYRHTHVLTVSDSTKDDLKRLGFKGPITVVPEGLEPIEYSQIPKATDAVFLYVGRLTPSKRIGHLLEALARFRRATGSGSLWLVGTGSPRYERSLVKLAQRLNIENHVVFYGRVLAPAKHLLMAKVRALLMTSVREGWGLVVTEANACGTPAVVYDVPGLRDSVHHESTGLVVPPRPVYLAEAMVRIWNDEVLYRTLTAHATAWGRSFSFEISARDTRAALRNAIPDRVLAADAC